MSGVRQHAVYAATGKPSQDAADSKMGSEGKPSDQWSKNSLIDGTCTADKNTSGKQDVGPDSSVNSHKQGNW